MPRLLSGLRVLSLIFLAFDRVAISQRKKWLEELGSLSMLTKVFPKWNFS